MNNESENDISNDEDNAAAEPPANRDAGRTRGAATVQRQEPANFSRASRRLLAESPLVAALARPAPTVTEPAAPNTAPAPTAPTLAASPRASAKAVKRPAPIEPTDEPRRKGNRGRGAIGINAMVRSGLAKATK